MSNFRKIYLLVIFTILLNFIAIYSFDYKEFFNDKNEFKISDVDDFSDIFFGKKYLYSDYTILKQNNILVLSGTFSTNAVLEEFKTALKINLDENITIDKSRKIDFETANRVYKIIDFLKEYMENGSKIVVKNNNIIFEGAVKYKRYARLVQILENEFESDTFFVDIDTLEFN